MSKRTINSFVNNYDFDKYLKFLDFDHKVLYRQSELEAPGFRIDELFRGKNYLAVIALKDTRDIAHFVVLRKDSDFKYSYMDCLGEPVPEFLQDLIVGSRSNEDPKIEVEYTDKRLMALDGIICGKYCLAFAMAGDISLGKWVDILTSSKKFKPDDIIDNLYRLEYSQTQITVVNDPTTQAAVSPFL